MDTSISYSASVFILFVFRMLSHKNETIINLRFIWTIRSYTCPILVFILSFFFVHWFLINEHVANKDSLIILMVRRVAVCNYAVYQLCRPTRYTADTLYIYTQCGVEHVCPRPKCRSPGKQPATCVDLHLIHLVYYKRNALQPCRAIMNHRCISFMRNPTKKNLFISFFLSACLTVGKNFPNNWENSRIKLEARF